MSPEFRPALAYLTNALESDCIRGFPAVSVGDRAKSHY